MSQEVLQILLSILAVVLSGGVSIGTYYLKRYLEQKGLSEEFALVAGIVESMVRAAEMQGAAAGWSAEEKKLRAVSWVSEKISLPKAEIENLVEAAVARLKSAKEELVKKGETVVPKTA